MINSNISLKAIEFYLEFLPTTPRRTYTSEVEIAFPRSLHHISCHRVDCRLEPHRLEQGHLHCLGLFGKKQSSFTRNSVVYLMNPLDELCLLVDWISVEEPSRFWIKTIDFFQSFHWKFSTLIRTIFLFMLINLNNPIVSSRNVPVESSMKKLLKTSTHSSSHKEVCFT